MTEKYMAQLTPDDNGTLLVMCPDTPELTTFGEERDDALLRAPMRWKKPFKHHVAPL